MLSFLSKKLCVSQQPQGVAQATKKHITKINIIPYFILHRTILSFL